MRKLVVGCGYLGWRVAEQWLARGDEVHALTRSPTRADELRAAGIRPVAGDVTQPGSLSELRTIGDVDTLLYAVGFDRTAAPGKREVYVAGLANVLGTIAAQVGRLLYVSSTSVYGHTAGEWVDEDSPCRPTSDNGCICLDAENVVRAQFPSTRSKQGPEAGILQLAGLYGPGRLLARIETLITGQPLSGRPDAWLNLIHVDDAAAAVLACEERGVGNRTYLVCDDQPVRRHDYYSLLAKLAGAPPPQFALSPGADTESLNKRCCNRRMHEELAVTLRYPTFREGLKNCGIEGLSD